MPETLCRRLLQCALVYCVLCKVFAGLFLHCVALHLRSLVSTVVFQHDNPMVPWVLKPGL